MTGPNSGLVDTVTLQRKVGYTTAVASGEQYLVFSAASPSTYTPVETVTYDYWTSSGPYGVAGELQICQFVTDASSNVLSTTAFNYWTTGSSGTAHLLQYMFTTDSYNRMVSAGGTSMPALYANTALTYYPSGQVSVLVSQGTGCSCNQGFGTYGFDYGSPSGNSPSYGNWTYQTTETLPNATTNTVYMNYLGETLLNVLTDPTIGPTWKTYYQYNSAGQLYETASPSAVSSYDTTHSDLGVTLNSTGLVNITNFYTGTTSGLSLTTSGGVDGYVESHAVQDGSNTGSIVPLDLSTYFMTPATNDGVSGNPTESVFPIATNIVYSLIASGGPQETDYTYMFFSGKNQIEQVTTILPVVYDEIGHVGGMGTTDHHIYGQRCLWPAGLGKWTRPTISTTRFNRPGHRRGDRANSGRPDIDHQ